jgi:hypothetical protein
LAKDSKIAGSSQAESKVEKPKRENDVENPTKKPRVTLTTSTSEEFPITIEQETTTASTRSELETSLVTLEAITTRKFRRRTKTTTTTTTKAQEVPRVEIENLPQNNPEVAVEKPLKRKINSRRKLIRKGKYPSAV